MATKEEGEGFKVVDRRGAEKAPETEVDKKPVEGPGWEMRDAKGEEPRLPPMSFGTFCLSLASSAMIHLGLAPMPESEKIERQLPLAQQTIDILELLEEKTRGNLTADEAKLLSAILYDLRMRYVDASKG